MTTYDDMVFKFGYGDSINTGHTVWGLNRAKTDPVAAAELFISSDNELNDGGIEITVEYVDANGAEHRVAAVLDDTDARTFISLGVQGIWVNRAYVSSENDALTGDVYISNNNTDATGNGIPDNLDNVLAFVPASDGQTIQAFYYVPKVTYRGKTVIGANLIGWMAGLNGNTSTTGSLRLAQKPPGGSWRTIERKGVALNESVNRVFPKPMSLATGTILKVEAVSMSAAADVDAQFDIELDQ